MIWTNPPAARFFRSRGHGARLIIQIAAPSIRNPLFPRLSIYFLEDLLVISIIFFREPACHRAFGWVFLTIFLGGWNFGIHLWCPKIFLEVDARNHGWSRLGKQPPQPGCRNSFGRRKIPNFFHGWSRLDELPGHPGHVPTSHEYPHQKLLFIAWNWQQTPLKKNDRMVEEDDISFLGPGV